MLLLIFGLGWEVGCGWGLRVFFFFLREGQIMDFLLGKCVSLTKTSPLLFAQCHVVFDLKTFMWCLDF